MRSFHDHILGKFVSNGGQHDAGFSTREISMWVLTRTINVRSMSFNKPRVYDSSFLFRALNNVSFIVTADTKCASTNAKRNAQFYRGVSSIFPAYAIRQSWWYSLLRRFIMMRLFVAHIYFPCVIIATILSTPLFRTLLSSPSSHSNYYVQCKLSNSYDYYPLSTIVLKYTSCIRSTDCVRQRFTRLYDCARKQLFSLACYHSTT